MKFVRLILVLGIILAALWFISTRVSVFPMHDFVEYWASGRLNFSGGDPYNADQMYQLEQSVGWKENEVLMMWNPPWTLPFAMLFGLLNYSFSRMLWFLVQLFIIFACAILLWELYGGEKKREWIAWIALLTFGPMLQTLKLGQVTVLVFLGSVGFLYFLRKGKDFWAGALASLVLIKPHLLYLFVLAILFWSLYQRRWKVLAGMGAAVILATGIAWIINPALFSQYILAIQSYPPEDWITATLGAMLRILLGSDQFFLQFVPSLLGLAWFVVFWIRSYKTWDWKNNLPLLILASVTTTSYGWAFDVALCGWAVIQIAVLFDFSRWNFQKVSIILTFLAVSLLNAFLSVSQHWFWWLSSFFLMWYLISYHYLARSYEPRPKMTGEAIA